MVNKKIIIGLMVGVLLIGLIYFSFFWHSDPLTYGNNFGEVMDAEGLDSRIMDESDIKGINCGEAGMHIFNEYESGNDIYGEDSIDCMAAASENCDEATMFFVTRTDLMGIEVTDKITLEDSEAGCIFTKNRINTDVEFTDYQYEKLSQKMNPEEVEVYLRNFQESFDALDGTKEICTVYDNQELTNGFLDIKNGVILGIVSLRDVADCEANYP